MREGNLEGCQPGKDATIITGGVVALLLQSGQLAHEQLSMETIRHLEIFYLKVKDANVSG